MPLKIAAPPWFGTIFFQHSAGQGFQENYWVTAANLDTALTDLVAIATARQAMFDSQCRVKFWRLSDATLKGDTAVKQADDTTLGTYGQGGLADMMPVEVGLKCRFQAADRYFATRILRMLPEDCITDGFWTPTAAMQTALANYKTAVLAKTTGVFKGQHEPAPPPAPIVKAWTSIIELSITTHKPGRPFGLRRGRSVLR
jgi:hypothetical protein